jgi:hypothetical protein
VVGPKAEVGDTCLAKEKRRGKRGRSEDATCISVYKLSAGDFL